MNRRQRRAAKTQGKPYSRLAIRGPKDPLRQSVIRAIVEAMESQIPGPGPGPAADKDKASLLLSICAGYVARIPIDQGRQKMMADIPTVFRDLVSANVATAITADRFEEKIGGVTPEKLRAMEGQEQ